MKKKILLGLVSLLFVFGMVGIDNAGASLINVAAASNGGSITGFSGGFSGVSMDTLIDEIFRPRSTYWQNGTVWWRHEESNYIEISFSASFIIRELVVQADDNDSYTMLYWNNDDSDWLTLWDVPNSSGGGMQTRPNPGDDSDRYELSSSVVTDKIRIKAASGDNSYSLSEVQAYGAPVPLPAALWLFGSGLFGLVGLRKRFVR